MSITQLLEQTIEESKRHKNGHFGNCYCETMKECETVQEYFLRKSLEKFYLQGVEEGKMKGQKEEAEKWIDGIKKNIQSNNQ